MQNPTVVLAIILANEANSDDFMISIDSDKGINKSKIQH